MSLDDHKLRVFCAVAETRSFSKASEIIHLTQPAVSLQIQALEELYGTKLFDRSSSAVTLTPAGEILYKYAKHILALYASAEKEIGDLTGLVRGSVGIGASTTIGNYLIPSVIADFRKTRPKIKVHLQVGNTKKIVELLKGGSIDIGLVEGEVPRQKFTKEKLLEDELVLIVPPQHPFAKRSDISIFEITSEPFIVREEGSGTRQMIEKYLEKHGLSLNNMNITMILGSTEAIKNAVEQGMGISIVSQWAALKEERFGTFKTLRFREERFVRDFTLIYQKYEVLSHAAEEFLNYLKTYDYHRILQGQI